MVNANSVTTNRQNNKTWLTKCLNPLIVTCIKTITIKLVGDKYTWMFETSKVTWVVSTLFIVTVTGHQHTRSISTNNRFYWQERAQCILFHR